MTVPEKPPSPRLDIGEGFNRAIEYTRRFMFTPFDFGTWLNIGVMVFIGSLGGGSQFSALSFNYMRGFGNGRATFDIRTVRHGIHTGETWVMAHLVGVILFGAAALVLGALIGLVLLWLSCRGRLMLIRTVARRDIRISENWAAVAKPAWSLFLFRIAVSLAGVVIYGALLIMASALAWRHIQQGANQFSEYFLMLLPLGGVAFVTALCFGVLNGLLDALVTPLMYHFDVSCLDGWRRLGALAHGNFWRIVFFLVIRAAYTAALGFGSLLVGCFTCCIGFLPVVRQTVLAFFYVFDRAFALYMLETLGPDYHIIVPDPRDLPPPPPVSEDSAPDVVAG